MGHSERVTMKTRKEVKSLSFYGVSENKKTAKRYITPAERKTLREKGELISLDIQKYLKESQNLTKNLTNEINANSVSCSVSQTSAPKTYSSRAFNLSHMNAMKRKSLTKRKGVDAKPSSPTINWAPSSLGKHHSLSNFSWRNLKLPNPNNITKKGPMSECQAKSTVQFNKENSSPLLPNKCLDIKISNTKKLDEEKVARCVKELTYDQCRVSLTRIQPALEKTTISLDSSKSDDNKPDTKFYPMFYPKTLPASSSPSVKSKNYPTQNENPATVSPEALHLSLPSTLKTKYAASPSTSPKSQQMIIDAGQKNFGATQCNICGMVYTVNHPSDQQHHSIYHKRFLACVKFGGWKKENEITSFVDGRILKVLPNDPKCALKKVNEIRSLIDIDLGFDQTKSPLTKSSKVTYLFISNDNQIAGCLVAEPITHAYRLLPSSELTSVAACSLQSEQVSCGVSRIWTYYPYRRSKIATRLMDALRNTFVMGCQLETNQVAFSDPTPDGIRFASRYCQTSEFLTYNLHH